MNTQEYSYAHFSADMLASLCFLLLCSSIKYNITVIIMSFIYFIFLVIYREF